MSHGFDHLGWPLSDLGEALAVLGRVTGLVDQAGSDPPPSRVLSQDNEDRLGPWIEATARHLGFEAEPVHTTYPDVERWIQGLAPALLHLPDGEPGRFLALVQGGRHKVSVLGPDLKRHRVAVEAIRTALCREIEAPVAVEVDRLLEQTAVPARRRSQARRSILRERLSEARLGGGWLLRPSPGASFWRQIRFARLQRYFFLFIGAHGAQFVLWLLSWWLIGRGALQGHLDLGLFTTWVLLLLTIIPLRLLVTWGQGRLALGLGGLLKQRLLFGALRVGPAEVRRRGVGQFLGQVIESDTVEKLALSGGFLALLAIIELILAAVVLGAGPGRTMHVLWLLGWLGLAGLWSWRYFHHRRAWTETRLTMTHELVERMIGHRTRLAQETPERWHEGEDQMLARYIALSGRMDGWAALLISFIPRGWLIIGLLGLVPAFIAGSTTTLLAIGLGGVLLAWQAFRKLERGLRHLVEAVVAWQQIAPLFYAAARPQNRGVPNPVVPSTVDTNGRTPLIDADKIIFRYDDQIEPVLRQCSLQIWNGERLLLEGASGGGKSTLASVLTGLRAPESGLLLLHGLDQQTLGPEGWRQRVASAPQFHENHVLTETFAFNLLMGRSWPPHPEDLREAETICRELGLGNLLERMPAGLLQMVGETGWQLSHGERSRLYIARALLQKVDVMILDESFAALDPKNLQRALRCVLNRAKTLLVIAHP